jgi:hypothetical protein
MGASSSHAAGAAGSSDGSASGGGKRRVKGKGKVVAPRFGATPAAQTSTADAVLLARWAPENEEEAYYDEILRMLLPEEAGGKAAASSSGSPPPPPVLVRESVNSLLRARSGLSRGTLKAIWAELLGKDAQASGDMTRAEAYRFLRLAAIANDGLSPCGRNLAESFLTVRPDVPVLAGLRVDAGGASRGFLLHVPTAEDTAGHVFACTSHIQWALGRYAALAGSVVGQGLGVPTERVRQELLAHLAGDRHATHIVDSAIKLVSATRTAATAALLGITRSATVYVDGVPAPQAPAPGVPQATTFDAPSFVSAVTVAALSSMGLNETVMEVQNGILPSWLVVRPHQIAKCADYCKADDVAAIAAGAEANSAAAIAPARELPWSWRPSGSMVRFYDRVFDELRQPSDSALHADCVLQSTFARYVLYELRLPMAVARYVWTLSDIGGDGMLDRFEFRIAHHLLIATIRSVPMPGFLHPDAVPAALTESADAFNRRVRRCNSVFISYRWVTDGADSRPLARLLADELRARYHLRVFIDVDNLPSGDIVKQLPSLVRAHDAFVPIWSPGCYDRSIDNPSDAVRVEVETALSSKRIVIAPFFDPAFFEKDNAYNDGTWGAPERRLPPSMAPILRVKGVPYQHAFGRASFEALHRTIQGWEQFVQ